MSWIERLENIEFTITTGDGKTYTPLWKSGEKTKNYNVSNYNFIDKNGGFSDRKKAQASKFPLVFWFQGENHIEDCDEFEKSADNPKSWVVKHPIYGNISGQPLSIKRLDVQYNITEITVDFWESINNNYPSPTNDLSDLISSKIDKVSEVSAQNYSSKINPTSKDQQIVKTNLVQVSSSFNKIFDNDNYADYQKNISKANSSVNKLIEDAENSAKTIHNLFMIPAFLNKNIFDKIYLFKKAFEDIKNTLLEYPTRNTKLYFESQAAICISSICLAATNQNDFPYLSRNEIEEVNDLILSIYQDYLIILDDSQISINDIYNTFHPDASTQLELQKLITESTGQLFNLAFDAKQERIIETDKETNLILLTHKYLGLDVLDENLEKFRELNNIKKDELLKIKKGRQIKFYV